MKRFNSASFAVNRWNVGCEGVAAESVAAEMERSKQVGREYGERFRRTKERSRLRALLLGINPHCDNCGRQLQGTNRNGPFYANITADRLSCADCLHIVRALAYVESEVPPCS